MQLHEYFTPEIIASYLTLTFLEIALAGDNLVLIAILSGRLPPHQRPFARRFGVLAAVVTRLALLVTLFWLAHLQTPLNIALPGLPAFQITPRTIVLGVGGAFLILKSFTEISDIFSGRDLQAHAVTPWRHAFLLTILQIAFFDVVFSLDSVIAALGLAQQVEVMAAAIITAALLMLFLVNPISNFIDRYRIVRLIALNFLTLIGALLIAEAAELAVPHVYFYIALAIAVVIQVIVLWLLAWSPGAQRLVMFVLVVIAIVGILGATLYLNRDTTEGQHAYEIIDTLWADVQRLATNAWDWIKSLLDRAARV